MWNNDPAVFEPRADAYHTNHLWMEKWLMKGEVIDRFVICDRGNAVEKTCLIYFTLTSKGFFLSCFAYESFSRFVETDLRKAKAFVQHLFYRKDVDGKIGNFQYAVEQNGQGLVLSSTTWYLWGKVWLNMNDLKIRDTVCDDFRMWSENLEVLKS
ncbi:MAG: hypothetical protein RL095_2912 [Verrucomicrobiota bacterium]|jgi:hypothetical protein